MNGMSVLQRLGNVAVVVVLLALFLPPAVAALKTALAPVLILAAVAVGLRLLWYWTSL